MAGTRTTPQDGVLVQIFRMLFLNGTLKGRVKAALCVLAVLLLAGLGIRVALHHRGKASPLAQTAKAAAGKQQNETTRIFEAHLKPARLKEDSKDFKSAASEYQRAFNGLPAKDGRRVTALTGFVRCCAYAGNTEQAISAFSLLCRENIGEAISEGEKICQRLYDWRQTANAARLIAGFQDAIFREKGRELTTREWGHLTSLSRLAKRIGAGAWMDEIKPDIVWQHDDRALLKGMAGCMQSLDAFLKATYMTKVLVGEGCGVSGRFEDHNYITLCQYPCKADLYLHWYAKTGFPEYQDMAGRLIGKMHRVYRATKDVNGQNWLPTGIYVNNDGKECGFYDEEKLRRHEDERPYDQSKSRYASSRIYMDAWGLGIWEVAKVADRLKDADRTNLVEILHGMVDFYHRPYMLKTEGDGQFWRTDAFCPLKPPAEIPPPDWELLGLDVIHAILALHELSQDTTPWNDSLKKFAAYYMRERPSHNAKPDQLIEYTDLRAMDLADYLDKVCGDKTLSLWLQNNIPTLYKTRKTKVCIVPDGKCMVYSPLPVMELLARYAPDLTREMWADLFARHVAPCGLHTRGHVESVNTSQYEGILDAGLLAWQCGALSDRTFGDGAEKILQILGSPRGARTIENWLLDPDPESRQVWGWEATPYAGYMNDVRPEGFYDGVAQAFYTQILRFNNKVPSYDQLDQFTSPGGHHTERIRFGQMSTFNLLDTHTASPPKIAPDNARQTWELEYVAPSCPAGTPCLGAIDATDIYFTNASWYEPTGCKIESVQCAGRALSFEIYYRLGLDQYDCFGWKGCDVDKATLAFLLPAVKPGEKGRITISFSKIAANGIGE